MTTLNMLEAKTQLCSLIKMLEDKEEDQFVICRNGKKIKNNRKYPELFLRESVWNNIDG